MTRDGWNDFNAGWSGGALRIGTIRAPAENGFWRDAENGHRDGRAPQQCPSRAANGSLGWTNQIKLFHLKPHSLKVGTGKIVIVQISEKIKNHILWPNCR